MGSSPNLRPEPGVVIFDFYGTLAHDVGTFHIDRVMAARGKVLPDHVREMWWSGDVDGQEHLEASQSREHYAAWQHDRLVALLVEADVHPGERAEILAELQQGRSERSLVAYPEVHAVLDDLRARGARLAVCSNWDWDLEPALVDAGLAGAFECVVSSAWVGARKPHPRIFEETLARLGTCAADVVFVGDTWGPDVDGPRACGMTPIYLQRDGHWADPSAPPAGSDRWSGVITARDLSGLRELW
jgi:putative hydrolase of the HAD superfamily